jgi:hypothetical protein
LYPYPSVTPSNQCRNRSQPVRPPDDRYVATDEAERGRCAEVVQVRGAVDVGAAQLHAARVELAVALQQQVAHDAGADGALRTPAVQLGTVGQVERLTGPGAVDQPLLGLGQVHDLCRSGHAGQDAPAATAR